MRNQNWFLKFTITLPNLLNIDINKYLWTTLLYYRDIYYLDMATLCRLDGKFSPLGRKHLNFIIWDFHLIHLFSIHLSPYSTGQPRWCILNKSVFECQSRPLDTWNNGKETHRWGVAEIQKMSPPTTGRCSRHAADQWECGTATRQPITTLLIFWCGRPDPYSFFLVDRMGSYF